MTATAAPVTIVGLSAYYHDAAAVLLRDGELVAAAQEERFSRKKNDPSFPHEALAYCLRAGGLTIDDVDHVVYYEKPWIKFERLLETQVAFAPRGFRTLHAFLPVWLREKLFLRRQLLSELGRDRPILFCEHHEAHMAAAFYPSPFDRAAILTVDGVGEWATTSYGTGRGAELTPLAEIHFPHSLGLLYAAFTAYLGFEVNEGEYKVMGLAPYGEPRFVSTIRDELIELRDDGSFRLRMDAFDFAHGLRMTNERFHRLFGGPPRAPGAPLEARHLDVARSVQVVIEEAVLRLAGHVHRETGEKNLVLAGGVALNCVANGRVLREGPFESLWIQPAAGDAGSALGAALAVWHRYVGAERPTPRGDAMHGTYVGPSWSRAEIRAFLDRVGARYEALVPDGASASEADAAVAEATASLVAEQRVVGFFQGRLEFGPRALGHRSILADARNPEMQRRVNLQVKFRESFRPFAPAVLREHVSEWFELDRDSPYMLLVAPLRADKLRILSAEEEATRGLERLRIPRSLVPAVTHVDGTARIQTVDGRTSPRFRALLEAFHARTGCPLLLNTSFNVRGEPIVASPEDAYRCLVATEIDALVLGDFLVRREGQPALPPRPPPPAKEKPPRRLDLSVFGLLMGAVLASFALFGFWRDTFELSQGRIALAAVGGVLALLGAGWPESLRLPLRGWMAFGKVMGTISSAVILSVLHVVVLTPTGLLRRVFAKDPLLLRTSAPSYWKPRVAETRGLERYEHPF